MNNVISIGTWELAREERNVVFPCIFDEVLGFYGGLSYVCLDGYWGMADEAGNIVLPCEYDITIIISDEEIASGVDADVKKRINLIKEEYAARCEMPYRPDDMGLRAVCEDGLWGYADDKGIVIPPQFTAASPVEDGFACVETGGRAMTLDITGGRLIPHVHGFSFYLTEEYAVATKEPGYNAHPEYRERWGVISRKTGRPIVPFEYTDLNIAGRHMIRVKRNGKWGIIDARIPAYVPA